MKARLFIQRNRSVIPAAHFQIKRRDAAAQAFVGSRIEQLSAHALSAVVLLYCDGNNLALVERCLLYTSRCV